jgi:predicted Fe-Mo cluster-binding NifX family protein
MATDCVNVACGTDDGINFTDAHFGDAKVYLIYSFNLETKEYKYVDRIKNTTDEEEEHGAQRKGQSVSELLKEVDVLACLRMGPNIARVRKNFVPVISRVRNIEKCLKRLEGFLDEIKQEAEKEKGIDREVIYIRAK